MKPDAEPVLAFGENDGLADTGSSNCCKVASGVKSGCDATCFNNPPI